MKKKTYSREEEIHAMIEIIKEKERYKENSENCMIIMVNGIWGSGKTTFLNQLCKEIEKEDNIEIFNYYNAYENDFYSNAYIPFFASMNDKINIKNELNNIVAAIGEKTSKGIIVLSYTITKSIFKSNLKNKIGIDLDDIKKELKDIKEEEEKHDIITEYKDTIKMKKRIKKEMLEICKDKIQVFIIDELDRCKPSFAMETLEIVKHFFDIDNCVFIISVDKLQLEESARAIYGAGIDSERYFSKLYDYQFNLPTINFLDAINFENIPFKEELLPFATTLFNNLNISLRDSKKIFNDLLSKYQDWTFEQTIFMLFMFTIKYTDLLFYNAIMRRDFTKYMKLIEDNYNQSYSKYLSIFSLNIKNEKNIKFVLLELEKVMNRKVNELGDGNRKYSVSIDSKLLRVNEIENDILDIVPSVNGMISVKDNIEKIIS